MKFLITFTEKGLDFGSEYNRKRLKQFAKDNVGLRGAIEPLLPESSKQRRFFEGAVVPLVAFYQEGMDYRDEDDRRRVRDWLKIEFNGEMTVVGGKAHKTPKSTKGELNKGFLERVMDWMADQGYNVQVLDPNEFKKWRDEIFPYGGPETFIDYLRELRKI